MTRTATLFLLLAAWTAAGPAQAAGEAAGLPPNVLLVVADDLGVDALAAYGEGTDLPSTPTLDALAGGGLVFRNAWSNPVCSTTRATLLTGRHSFRTGIGWLVSPSLQGPPLPLAEQTIPEVLDVATGSQYAHAAFGKWHLGDGSVGGAQAPNLAGFSHFAGTLANFFSPYDYFSWPKVVNGATSVSTTYATTDHVDEALSWIATAPQPWFCYLAFNNPHTPFHAPPPELHSVDLSQPTNRLYFKAMVEALDTELGRLLATLPPEIGGNTMVVFVGDNGSHSKVIQPPFDPQHSKSTLYEGGINVPLIVNGPLVTAPGSESLALVQTTDVMATVLDIAGAGEARLAAEAGQDSISFAPYFTAPNQASLRKYAYAELFRPGGPLSRPLFLPQAPPGPPATVCQDDFGFGGPGSAVLTVCGEPLYGGYLDSDTDAMLLLQNAPPDAAGILYVGYQANPTPMFGGTIVPNPAFTMAPVTTDATGSLSLTVSPDPDNLGYRYYQVAVADAGLPGGYAISNAVAVETLPADMEAVRDAQYKLILDNRARKAEFFDLDADPFEQSDLLQGPLTAAQRARYLALRKQILTLRFKAQ